MKKIHTYLIAAFISLMTPAELSGQLIPNDDFEDATVLFGPRPIIAKGSFVNTRGSLSASHESGEPRHGGTATKGSVWYSITSGNTRRLMATVTSETADVVLALYTGKTLKDAVLVHRFKDCASPCISRKKTEPLSAGARVEFEVIANQTYYFAVDYESGRPGTFEIRIDGSENPLKPEIEVLPGNASWESLLLLDETGKPIDPSSKDRDFFSTWTTPKKYDGPAFTKSSPSPFGWGELDSIPPATYLGGSSDYAPPMRERHSAYFRTTFTPELDLGELGVEGIFDDGAIIYLNGREVARINVAPTADSSNWKAVALGNHVTDEKISVERTFQHAVIRGLNLKAGVPVNLAVSLHNANPTSSDLGMALRLFGVTR